MIQALLQRGIDDGTFRGDRTVDYLGFVLGQLLQAAARMAAERQAGVEKAAALPRSAGGVSGPRPPPRPRPLG
jgi:hypothetical protein